MRDWLWLSQRPVILGQCVFLFLILLLLCATLAVGSECRWRLCKFSTSEQNPAGIVHGCSGFHYGTHIDLAKFIYQLSGTPGIAIPQECKPEGTPWRTKKSF